MPERFVILLHTGPGADHYDLMLADGAALATWRLESDPAALPVDGQMPAAQLPPHRLAYLDYEGPVSGGRGQVRRVARGDFERLPGPPGPWRIGLDGEGIRGEFELLRAADAAAAAWSLRRLA